MSVCVDCTIANGSALRSPYHECSRCGLDYDDETFYRRKSDRRTSRSVPNARRQHETTCIGCRRREEDAEKGAHPSFDPASVTDERLQRKIQTARYSHADRFPVSARDLLEHHSWTDINGIGAIRSLPRHQPDAPPICPCCRWTFLNLDDITLDIKIPDAGFSFVHNVWFICQTCNNGKKRFKTIEQISRWQRNWERWHEHASHVLQRGLFPRAELVATTSVRRSREAPSVIVLGEPRKALTPSRPREVVQLTVPGTWQCSRCHYCAAGPTLEQCPKCGWMEAADA